MVDKNMKIRSKLIKEIAQYGPSYNQAKIDIQKYPLDSDQDLYLLTREDVIDIFERYVDGKLTSDQIVDWANFLEGREDCGYEPSAENLLNEIIFLLANPDINYPVNAELINRLKSNLKEIET